MTDDVSADLLIASRSRIRSEVEAELRPVIRYGVETQAEECWSFASL